MARFLMLLDKMCKYEMNPASIVRYRADTILSTDRQTDTPVYHPTIPSFTDLESTFHRLVGIHVLEYKIM